MFGVLSVISLFTAELKENLNEYILYVLFPEFLRGNNHYTIYSVFNSDYSIQSSLYFHYPVG